MEKGSREDLPQAPSEKHFSARKCRGKEDAETEKARGRVGGHSQKLDPSRSECDILLYTALRRTSEVSVNRPQSLKMEKYSGK